jgi:hypothetical protein
LSGGHCGTGNAAFVVACFSVRTSRQALELSKSQHERDERPWLGQDDSLLNFGLDESSNLLFTQIIFRDSGRTPALEYEGRWASIVTKSVVTTDADHETPLIRLAQTKWAKPIPMGSVAPGEQAAFRLYADPVTEWQFQDIADGKDRLYFIGEITYRDSASEHHTSFCFWVNGSTDRPTMANCTTPTRRD